MQSAHNLQIELPMEAIRAFCERWKIVEFAVFGSVLRDDFRPDSDIDVLVSFAPDARWSLFDMVDAKDELAALLGREVDMVDRRAIERSRNYIRRKEILNTTRVVYAA